jgi:methylated-DNA-[protein]-cysteine S-methyltransferase
MNTTSTYGGSGQGAPLPSGGPDAATWQRARERLITGAQEQGLIDVAVERHESPLGTLLLAASTAGLVRLGLPGDGEEEILDELAERISPRVLRAPSITVTEARRQLDQYFERRRRMFQLELDWSLARGFRREVLQATARIPYGSLGTYSTVAAEAGSPRAVRAAGTALALNPIPIVVPCHRVLRADGGLGNYRGGAETKAQLLRLEGAR